jgi:hypothetical protein
MPPSRTRFKTSRTFDALFLLAIALGTWQIYVHRIAVDDWLFFLSYKPSPQIVTLANRVDFTAEGRYLFYRGNPEIVTDQSTVNSLCGPDDAGCLTTSGRIVIYDPTGDTQNDIVTAAHETLHLAYRRYNASTRASVDDLVSNALVQLAYNSNLQTELSGDTGDDRLDEAHSYIGTEYAPIPADLENHYKTYFKNRALIVAAYTEDQNRPEQVTR